MLCRSEKTGRNADQQGWQGRPRAGVPIPLSLLAPAIAASLQLSDRSADTLTWDVHRDEAGPATGHISGQEWLRGSTVCREASKPSRRQPSHPNAQLTRHARRVEIDPSDTRRVRRADVKLNVVDSTTVMNARQDPNFHSSKELLTRSVRQ